MAVRRGPWESLGQNHRNRLSRAGITPESYAAGASLKKARGHAATPEHGIDEALRNPEKYQDYIEKDPERLARALNKMRDAAYRNMKRRVGHYIKYNDKTVRANVYGGIAGGEDVPGMEFQEAAWTAKASAEEIRANAREQYRGNPWYYH
jgi:hypothetical protein